MLNRRTLIAGAAGAVLYAQAKPAAAATDVRMFVEGLRNRSTPNGVMSSKGLKMAGEDPLPKGAALMEHSVMVFDGVTLDGWDLGGRGITVKGRAKLHNILSTGIKGPKTGGPLYPIHILPEGDLEWAENIEMTGTYGKVGGPSKALAAHERDTSAGLLTGKLRMLRRSRFEGFPQDHLYTYGVPGGQEIVEENYFGPQWAVPGTAPHADVFTVGGAAGHVIWRRNLMDHTGAGRPVGINNLWRMVRNKASFAPVEWMTAEQNVAHYMKVNAFPVQISSGGKGNWNRPRIEFIGNWIGSNSNGKIFYPGCEGEVTQWVGNRDVDSGQSI